MLLLIWAISSSQDQPSRWAFNYFRHQEAKNIKSLYQYLKVSLPPSLWTRFYLQKNENVPSEWLHLTWLRQHCFHGKLEWPFSNPTVLYDLPLILFLKSIKIIKNNWQNIRSISFATAMNAVKTYFLQASAYMFCFIFKCCLSSIMPTFIHWTNPLQLKQKSQNTDKILTMDYKNKPYRNVLYQKVFSNNSWVQRLDGIH